MQRPINNFIKSSFILGVLLSGITHQGVAQDKKAAHCCEMPKQEKQAAHCCEMPGDAKAAHTTEGAFHIPDAQLVNQNGEKVSLQALTKDKVVALKFHLYHMHHDLPANGS